MKSSIIALNCALLLLFGACASAGEGQRVEEPPLSQPQPGHSDSPPAEREETELLALDRSLAEGMRRVAIINFRFIDEVSFEVTRVDVFPGGPEEGYCEAREAESAESEDLTAEFLTWESGGYSGCGVKRIMLIAEAGGSDSMISVSHGTITFFDDAGTLTASPGDFVRLRVEAPGQILTASFKDVDGNSVNAEARGNVAIFDSDGSGGFYKVVALLS